MLLKAALVIALAAAALVPLVTCDAHAEIFTKVDGVTGPVTNPSFQKDIPLTSMQFGTDRPVSLTAIGLRAGNPSPSDISIGKNIDLSSTQLVNDVLVGKTYQTVDIYLVKLANAQYFTYNHITLTNVVITSYSMAASSSGDVPTERLSLNYGKISSEYTVQNLDGSAGQQISTCWDALQEKECTVFTQDTTPPTTTSSLSGTAGTNGWYVSPVTVTLSSSDNAGGSGVKATTYSLDGGAQTTYSAPFAVTADGNHTLTFNSTDNAGNVEAVHTIYIPIDTTPPVISVPANITKEATGPLTMASPGIANATDAVDGQVTVESNATSTYPVGTTIIQYNATDLAGNTAYAYQSVTITDTTPPVLSLPVLISAQATGPSGAIVNFTANATDLVDGPVTPVCAPPSGSMFAFGNDTVACTATDAHNNKATGTFEIMIINKIPPKISIISPQENAFVRTPTIPVSGNASDIVAVSSISYKIDNGPVSMIPGITQAPALNWSFATDALPLGPHTIEVNATDSAGLVTVSTVHITYAAPTVTIPGPSGTGQVTFSSGSGGFTALEPVTGQALATPPPPGSYPLGFFSWNVTGFAPATSDTITVSSPVPLHPQSQYFKLVGGAWVPVPVAINGNNMTFTISDNGPYDSNPAQGTISDPGGVASPTDGRVSGGGNIGKGTNFGFEVSSDLAKKDPIRGTFEYHDRYVKLDLHSSRVSFLAVGQSVSNATMAGTTSYDRHDRHERHGQDYGFVATISDPDKSGEHDTFAITVTNSTGYVVYHNSGTVKGHIEIHKFSDREDRSDSGTSPRGNPNDSHDTGHGNAGKNSR